MSPNIPITSTSLLEEALTHRSYLNENPAADKHNERLEFLGDAVLELAVSEFLYQKYPKKPEGKLTAFRSSLVKTTTLANVARTLDLGNKLRLSKGEELSGGRQNTSLLANTFEAVIGALYLDQGYEAVVAFLQQLLFPEIDRIVKQGLFKDHKSLLQEIVQSQGHNSPIYSVVGEKGPDHDKVFTVTVEVDGQNIAQGIGKSKQTAQQQAASKALEKIGDA